MIPDKREVMLYLLQDAWVLVHLDGRRQGVILPEHLKQERHVILQYGYNMPVPIDDFVVDERGISATLSFRRVAQTTFIPWSAVFAITDGDKRSMLWQEDLPADLELKADGAEAPPEKAADKPPEKEKEPEKPAKPGKKPRPSYLKLVD
jgi:stringent starvation protein B